MVNEEDVSLKNAFEFLVKELDSKMISWASYGEHYRNIVRKQCSTFGLGYTFESEHLNVKVLFKLRHSAYVGSYGMDVAYWKVIRKEIDGTHHRGGDDAKNNIAMMLGTLLNTK